MPESALKTEQPEDIFGTKEFDTEINALLSPEVKEGEKGAEPEKKSAPEPEKKPEEKKAGEVGAEGAEGKKEEKAEGEKEGEAEKKEEGKEPPPAPEFPLDTFKEVFPEAMSAEDVLQQSKRLREMLTTEQRATGELREMLEETPALKKVIKAVAEGAPIHTALKEALEEVGEPPDPTDEPEKYKEYLRKEVEHEQRKKAAEADRKKAEQRMEEIRRFGMDERKRFRNDVPMSDDEFKTFTDWAKSIIEGDPSTGQPPKNFLHSLYRAYRYGEDLARARQDAKKEGANEALRQVIDKGRKEKTGDGLPHPKGGQEPTQPKEDDILSDIERSVSTNAIFT